jgi:hypothetical protein
MPPSCGDLKTLSELMGRTTTRMVEQAHDAVHYLYIKTRCMSRKSIVGLERQ